MQFDFDGHRRVRAALSLTGALAVLLTATACDDDPFAFNWTDNPDTVLLYSMARPELGLVSIGLNGTLRLVNTYDSTTYVDDALGLVQLRAGSALIDLVGLEHARELLASGPLPVAHQPLRTVAMETARLDADGLSEDERAASTLKLEQARSELADAGIDADWLISQRWVVA